ncbi:MAG: PPC domain-containing protein, partial [Chloroflexota bacterium]
DETADENGVAELALVSDDTDTLGEYDVIVTRDNDEIAMGVFTLASDITNAITDDNDDDDEQADDEQQDDDTVDVGSIDLNAELEYELTGELTDDEPFVEYLFVGTEGQEVTITLDSEDFDTYLFLVDEDGNELISNDDSRGTLNSQIVDFELPYTGEYSILVSSFSFVVAEQAETGDFDLIIEATEASNDDDDTVDTGDVDIVAGGDAIVDELDVDNQTREYVFAGEAGSAVTITLDSDQFDTYLVLLDENGSEITFNDDSRGSLNSQIASFELPYTGEYTIVVTSYGNRVFGDTVVGEFTLTLESVVFLRGEYDETIELVFDGSASTQSITFDADAGDVISITADSGGDFDTVATLTDEFGRVIASDDDGGSGFDPEIERVVIELTGSYTLAISTFNTGDEGEVDVTINLDDVRTLDNDEVRTVRLNNKMNADVLTLEGEAGDIISLEIDLVNGSIADLAIIASQNGFQLMNYTTFGLPSTITLGFEVPADGTVIISFRDNGQVNAELEVSIERE